MDGSDASKMALQECLKVVDPVKDSVDCCSFDMGGDAEKLRPVYEAMLSKAKVAHFRFNVIKCDGDIVPVAVTRFFKKEDTPDYDFIVLGSKGAGVYKKPGPHYLGTVAEKVITCARTNLILVAK